jgi:hypothetical protein
MSRAPRSGVALIIAISVLAALLFLALPFLYSQSASMAGARSAAYDGEARRGQAMASGLGAAVAVYAQGLHLSPDYAANLGAALLSYGQSVQVRGETDHPIYAETASRVELRADQPWRDDAGATVRPALDGTAVPTSHGIAIEDQSWISARMDPQTLDAVGWARLLRMAGISDPATVSAVWVADQQVTWVQNNDAQGNPSYGRLAYGLQERLRTGLVIHRLEDLSGIDPQVLPLPWHQTWTLPNENALRDVAELDINIKSIGHRGFRSTRLSIAEIEALRPYLAAGLTAALIPAQARAGLIDLGNVVAQSGNQYELDSHQPRMLLPGDRLIGASGGRGWITQGTGASFYITVQGGAFTVGGALGVAAIPGVNINALPAAQPTVRWFRDFWDQTGAFQGNLASGFGWPADPVAAPIRSLAELPQLFLVDPRGGDGRTDYLRPPVTVTNWGIIAVEGAATARDAQGRIQTTHRQRTVVQAVPQERPIEAKWETQAEFEALVRQRHGSWMVAGPHPTNRIEDWGANAGDMAKLADPGWIEPAPLPSFSRNPAFTFDWKRTFGLDEAVVWPAVLGADVLTPAPDPQQRLRADGLHLGTGDSLGWSLTGNPPAVVFGINGDEMSPRHLSMRFRLSSAPSGIIDLIDVRGDDSGAAQSRWRVWYDAAAEMLVLGIANAAAPWNGSIVWTTGSDRPGEIEDDRCAPGAYPFAPAWPMQQVEFRYKATLTADRWYHLQAYCASDRPGYHGLILDGIVGRDAFAAGAFANTGDHYTLPSLRLDEKLDEIVVEDGNDLIQGDLDVRPPPGLQVSDVLPRRGTIRIGDEYLSYDDIAGSTLKGVQRARRVATRQDPTAPLAEQWPVTQQHEVGTTVLPGWTQTTLVGAWQTGGTQTRQDFAGLPPADVSLTVANQESVTVADPGRWPVHGKVRCVLGTSAPTAYFVRTGSTVRFWWLAAIAAGTYTPVLCSIEVDDLAGFNASGGLLHLQTEADGRCEWIRYEGVLEQTSASPLWNDDQGTAQTDDDVLVPWFPVGTRFFINSVGWPAPAYVEPMLQVRGAVRTSIRSTVWPTGTTVLPVQNMSGAHRLESGDVVTVVAPGQSWFPPQQMVVRHAARDGYPYDGIVDGADEVTNTLFALTAAVPSGVPNLVVALIGRGWNGADLSTYQPIPGQRRGQLPRLAGLGATPRIVIGSPGMVVDDLCAAKQFVPPPPPVVPWPRPWVDDANAATDPCTVESVFTSQWDAINGIWQTVNHNAIDVLPMRLRTAGGLTFGNTYGLLKVGGEAFAYRPIANNEVELFARAQLGGVAVTDPPELLASQSGHERLSVMPLPIGPVAELASPLAGAGADVVGVVAQQYYRDAETWPVGRGSQAGDQRLSLAAPATLLSADDGSAVECLRLVPRPYSNQVVAGAWLRGLHGSAVTAWTGQQLIVNRPTAWVDWSVNPPPPALQPVSPTPSNPAVIGWWPRYAPGMPGVPGPEHLRSRSHAWAGFALRLHGSRFDPGISALSAGVAEVEVVKANGWVLEARALAAGTTTAELFNWDASPMSALVEGDNPGLTDPFSWSRFANREVDGAELRLHWHRVSAGTGLDAIAAAQGRAPRIGAVRLRCVAPTRILSVEEVR